MENKLRHIRTLFLICIVLCRATGVEGQTAKKQSPLKFGETVWNFGDIDETAGPVSHTFTFTNTGAKPLVIENVEVSCGCTTPEYSRAPVRPGATGTLRIIFDPADRPGVFTKEIYVSSGNRAYRDVIRITGNVAPRPRTVEDDYPVLLGSGVRIDGVSADFRYVGQGTARSMVVRWINTSDKAATVSLQEEPAVPWLKTSAPATLCAGCKGEITLTADLSGTTLWGMTGAKVYLSVNGKRYNTPISVTAVGADDFSKLTPAQKASAPRAQISSQFKNFSDIKKGTRASQEFTLANEGKSPLVVRAIQFKRGVSCTLKPGTQIAPGTKTTFTITLDTGEYEKGRVFESATLIVNDPQRPMREIRLVANLL